MLKRQRTCTALLFKVATKCLKRHYAKMTKVSATTEYYHSYFSDDQVVDALGGVFSAFLS